MRVCLGKFVPLSTEEFLGRRAAVVYFGGCNWKCPYCNVPQLLDEAKCEDTSTGNVFTEIIHARDFIDSVVFTGGEPCIHGEALLSLCKLAKSEGLYVKVQTNGSKPGVVKELLAKDLVDMLGIDIKALFKDYADITGVETGADQARESIQLARASKASWEAVIPVIMGVNDSDVPAIAKQAGAPLTVLRAFEPGGTVDGNFKGEQPSRSELIALAKKCKRKVHIRTKTYGEEAVD